MMSIRARNREICADCSAPDARWASINRGILICDECCSIHRGLGRHSSQVRHLTQTLWPPSQLQMVKSLYNNGANSIWEHSLLDPSSIMSGKRKANPQDRVHPNKTDFIKAKYQMLAFVHRMPCREDDSVTAKDLSKQLHSSVRTGNLETCLRLLSLGAQANFFHPEKGNTPLHVAAKAGQLLQAELLTVYGADPGALDSSGNTPIDYARQAGHQDLADRLVEIQFELTDRIAFYLCGRKPDHKNGQHFLIPQVADSSLDLSELAKAAKKKLQSLSNHQFEELAMDVYDEVDRRETDADNVELILKDISNQHSSESPETDQPDYDSVASDEDTEPEVTSGKDERAKSSESSDLSDSPITVQEFMEVKSALNASEAKIQQLLKVNCHLSEELRLMQSKLNSLQNENSSLKWQTPNSLGRPQDLPHRAPPRGCRAMSMYETGSSLRQYHPRGETVHPDTNLTLQPLPSNIGKGPSVTAFSSLPSFPSSLSWSWNERTQRGCSLDAQRNMPENDYDKTLNHVALEDPGGRGSGWLGDGTVPQSENPSEVECDSNLPCTEDVISKTELITKNIQELLRAAQENNHESFVPCSERILVAVTEMATLFPKRPSSEMVRGSLRLLTSSASRLQGECQKATPHDSQQVIQCAYDIAKAAKQLVTVTTKDSN
ncbi:ARF GTPase-activating protein GIT2-like isoform X17 [Myxocyprinus asiaticus]|uniref:ARF GTPase-activating protein GIT2-like isoform X16 n=1 Tax=Myxocyprinus asiaticus TaxID=70543 RepID=UPI002221DF5A|nr:ARF GTPase-activating protein GIT2-like isoform X16 [Myxocyprinus asiaticus]XP_051539090.1 ARF GTPase-activating protein GIT2-like isoform X17 [Myxocyprinus asiaticus]